MIGIMGTTVNTCGARSGLTGDWVETGTKFEPRCSLWSRNQWWTDRRRHGPATLVNETFANDEAASGRAVTLYVPPRQLGVQFTLAMPFTSVIANGLESAHEAPLVGAVKSTRTPGAGRLVSSSTFVLIVEPLLEA